MAAESDHDGISLSPFDILFVKVSTELLEGGSTAAQTAAVYSTWMQAQVHHCSEGLSIDAPQPTLAQPSFVHAGCQGQSGAWPVCAAPPHPKPLRRRAGGGPAGAGLF